MTWKNHKLTTFAAVFSMTGSFAASSVAAASSHLPDLLEFRGVVPHRTVTHYPYPFLVGAAVFWFLLDASPRPGYYAAFFAMIGILLHQVQDGLSLGGIPLITPGGKRLGFKWYVTKESSEWVVVVCMLVGCLLLAAFRGFLSLAHIEYTVLVAMQMFIGVVRIVGGGF